MKLLYVSINPYANKPILLIGIAFVVIFIIKGIYKSFAELHNSPFSYPYFIYYFKTKRKNNMDDVVDNFLNSDDYEQMLKHQELINDWKEECRQLIENESEKVKKLRLQQYNGCVDDEHAYIFLPSLLSEGYVRYNSNEKHNYENSYSFDYLRDRYNKLEVTKHECTLNEYHAKNQRRLLTKSLREEIIERDNYTCQMCGKYMPDGVGLQIDHIIPISRGGKTVRSNLQVLCSKCNGSKSNKILK